MPLLRNRSSATEALVAAAGTRRRVSVPSWPPSYVLAAAFAGAGAVSTLAVLGGGLHHPAAALAAFAVLGGVASLTTRPWAAPMIAAITWLFDNGFITNRHAHLAWHGAADTMRMLILMAAAAAGAVLGLILRSVSRT